MRNNLFYLKFILLGFFLLFYSSCATTQTSQQDGEGEELFSEEELDFLSEEEEYFEEELAADDDEFSNDSINVANKDTQEAQEAEDELREIEDEFADFIDEAEDAEISQDELEEESSSIAEVDEAEVESSIVLAEDAEISQDELEEESSSIAEVDEAEVESSIVLAEDAEISQDELEEESSIALEDGTAESIEDGIEESVLENSKQDSLLSNQSASSDLINITNIRYENQQVFIDTVGGTPAYRSRFNEATKQFIIEIPQAVIIDQLKWPYIMKDFNSGFALLQADQKDSQLVRIIVQMRPTENAPLLVEKDSQDGFILSASAVDLTVADQFDGAVQGADTSNYEQDSFEEIDNTYSDLDRLGENDGQILHAKTIEEFLLEEHKFYGHPITLDVRETNLKDILNFLVEDSGINMVISSSIPSTKINIRLQEVPWDQALVLIMKKNKLGYVREGNVVTISSLKEIQDHQKELQSLINTRENLIPLQLEIIPLAYAKAGSVSSQIDLFKTSRGRINIDNDNNSLIIHETAQALENMKKLIQKLDRTPKQVMISAKIVEASESFTRNFGVSWGITGETFNPLVAIGALSQIEITPAPLLRALPGAPDQGTLGTNLVVGNLGPGFGDLDISLGFAESDGHARVLSSPRIMALNGQSASVNQTTESIAFSAVTTESGTQTEIQRSPINLNLNVTPQITNVNSIYMQVSMTRGSEGAPISDDQGSTARPTSNKTASTNILVKSGHTAVIGGIYETRNADSLQGIPFLKSIPVVSWLFSQVRNETSRTELLLFLTPRIIDIGQEKINVASEETIQ